MSLTPLLQTPAIFQFHAFLARAALVRYPYAAPRSALIIAGAFTLVPGRIMNHAVFGMLEGATALCG